MEEHKLWKHQEEALLKFSGKQFAGIFFDTGTGKTATAIHLLRNAMNKNVRFLRTLVFCPQIVVPNWKDEIAKHSKIERTRVLLLGNGSAKQRQASFQEWQGKHPNGFIAVLNYEALLMPALFKALKDWSPEVVIYDELHRLKSHDAQRSKLAFDLANPHGKPRPIVMGLTGSPILNSPEDIFMQYKILDGGKTFGDNYHVFKRLYFVNRNAGAPSHVTWPKWEIKTLSRDGFDAVGTIRQKIAPSSMYVRKEDCLDLPPLVQQTIHVPLSKEQEKHYNEMKNDFITYTNSSACVASLAITKALRLSQIVSGYLPINYSGGTQTIGETKDTPFEDSPRLDALSELLTDITPAHKVLVWAVWKSNYAQIKERLDKLKIKYVEVHGDIPNKKKFENVAAFNSDPSIRVFLGNPAAGGIGINLTCASYSIFYSRTTSLEQSIQAEARNYRHGSEVHEKITRIDLVSKGTIDEVIMDALARKEEVSFEILKNNLAKI